MTFISYAQNFEDVLLWRALGHVERGHYLDVGAQDPVIDSVSLAFYKAGWRGVHVEATAAYAAQLREARPDETVIQAAVTDKPGPMTFYEIPGTGLSTGNKEVAQSHRKSGFENQSVVVPSIRLDDLLAMENRDIHWMKIDVEGMEDAVLRSWGDSPIRPWVLVIEATYPSSQKPTHLQWINEVLRRGYKEVYFDGLSKFFLHESQEALAKYFSSPPNVFDGFSVNPDHFSARESALQLEAADLQFKAKLEEVKSEARQKIDHARAEATASEEAASAAAAQSAKLQSDLSATVERVVSAQREHRETITRLWSERQSSEHNLRQEARGSVEKLEANLRAAADSAHSEQLALTRAHSTAIAALSEELRAARVEMSNLAAREQSLLREHKQDVAEIRQRANEEVRLAKLSTDRAVQERDEARAEAAKERDAAHAEARRIHEIAMEAEAFSLNANEPSPGRQLPMQSSMLPTEQTPFLRAKSLAELLAWSDLNFIRCAYVTVLGRQPDPEGEAVYTAMIRAGESKLKVLHALRTSPEGRAHDPGIAGLDRALRQFQRGTMPGIGWFYRRAATRRLEDPAKQLRKLESAMAISLDESQALRGMVEGTCEKLDAVADICGSTERQAANGLAAADALRTIMTSFVGEFRAFREEQGARSVEQAERNAEQAARDAEQAARDAEQTARNAEQAARHLTQTEYVQGILTSFVGEFRAYRDEDAARSRGVLESVRGLKASLANEFDAVRSEQSMRTSELRDLINTGLDGSFPTGLPTPFKHHDNGDPAFEKLGPTSARIVKNLKSSRNYAS